MLGFESLDCVTVLQGQADVVQAIEQAVLAESVHFKVVDLAVRTGHGLRRQINAELIALARLGLLEQFINFGLGQDDRQHAVLEAVVEEDVGIARRDDRTEAVLFQRPGRVFTTGAATEVLPRQQHAGALITRKIQHEILVDRTQRAILPRLTDIQITPLIKQVLAKAGALDRLQELLGDDLIGVDVGTIKRSHQATVLGKSFHLLVLRPGSIRAHR